VFPESSRTKNPKLTLFFFFFILQVTSTETLSGVGACNFSAGKGASAWISNPLPIRLYYASGCHICKLCTHYKKIQDNLRSWLYQLLLVFGVRPANQSTVTSNKKYYEFT